MKKYIHLLKVIVFDHKKEDGGLEFSEIKSLDEKDIFPMRFYAIPRIGDVFFVDEVYYEVILVQYEAAKKNWPRPVFFQEGVLFVKEIGDKMKFRDYLSKKNFS